jgi:signal transduction histidine kinase
MSLLERAQATLRGRLALSLVAGLVAVLGLGFFGLHLLIRQQFYAHMDEDLALRMDAIAAYAAAHPGRESIAVYMPQFRTRAHEDFFQVWDSQGRTLARSESSLGRDLPRLASVARRPTTHDLVLPDGHRGRAVSEIFELPPGDPRLTLEVVTAEETEPLDSLERRMHAILALGGVVIIVAAIGLAMFAIRRGLAPVRDLARSLESADPDDLRSRLEVGPLPGELRPVAARFAGLLDRLLAALARERRYARNVAHELRSPIAEMRLLADVGTGAEDLEAARSAMRQIHSAAGELEQIVSSLLALTRCEAGLEAPQPEPVDLCAELRRQINALAGSVSRRGMCIETQIPDEVWVHTDSALLQRLIANLLGNAIAHSPRGSAVRLELEPRGRLSIGNPAPQLRPADVPQLSEQFLRIGAADGETHAGLGLPLAAAIAKVLGLRLELELRSGGWFVASVDGFRALSEPATPSPSGG